MALPKAPRWVYTDGTGAVNYLMSLPQRPWDIGETALGGFDIAAGGAPASFEIRRDYILHLVLRFPESERASVTRLVRWMQRSGAVAFYPDQASGTNYTVYGVSPAMGEEVRPTRDPEELSTLELAVSIRTTSAEFTNAFYS